MNNILWKEIKDINLPENKYQKNSNSKDHWCNVRDKAKIVLKNGDDIEIRIIYGGIYLLATLLNNPTIEKVIENS